MVNLPPALVRPVRAVAVAPDGKSVAASRGNQVHVFELKTDPADKKGAALGLNAAGGNIGASFVQFFLPIVVGGAGAFGLVKASQSGIVLERAGYLYAALAAVAAGCAWWFMNNLHVAMSRPRAQLAVLRYRHTWIMSLLYIGTFGSFIGYSSAMPLLIKINFWNQPVPAIPGIGIKAPATASSCFSRRRTVASTGCRCTSSRAAGSKLSSRILEICKTR